MRRFLFISTWIGIALIGLGTLLTAWAIIQIHSGIIGLFATGWIPYTIGSILALTGTMIGRFCNTWPILAIFGIVYCMFHLSTAIWTGGDMDYIDGVIVFLLLIPGLANIILGLVISQLKKKRKQEGFSSVFKTNRVCG
jgi:hypothetical protein